MGLIRLLLALAVLLPIVPPRARAFIGGGTAVQAFFIVSGFYMSLVLIRKISRHARTFWTNRLRRLAPAYVTMMLIAGIALGRLGPNRDRDTADLRDGLSNPCLRPRSSPFENILVIGQHWLYWFKFAPDGGLYFDPSGGLPTATANVGWQALVVPQSWSLSIELIFYALVPVARCDCARGRSSALACGERRASPGPAMHSQSISDSGRAGSSRPRCSCSCSACSRIAPCRMVQTWPIARARRFCVARCGDRLPAARAFI